MYRIHNDKRGLCLISRGATIQSAVQEWIAKVIRREFPKSNIYCKSIWDNELPSNSGGGSIHIDRFELPFEWEVVKEPTMELTRSMLVQPIEVYVLVLETYSKTDGRMLNAGPVTVGFNEESVEKYRVPDTDTDKWRVCKCWTCGSMGLQEVIDKLVFGDKK